MKQSLQKLNRADREFIESALLRLYKDSLDFQTFINFCERALDERKNDLITASQEQVKQLQGEARVLSDLLSIIEDLESKH